MSEEKTFTKAELDAAIADANKALEGKRDELLNEIKTLKADLRKHKEISPEDFAALESERDALASKLAAAEKTAKDAVKQAETATKALESEQGAARKYALEAELASAIAEGNVIPSLVPAFKALVSQQAKADLVDGQYVVNIGEKAARDHIKSFLESDEGKAFRAAPANNGSGAPGSQGGGSAAGKFVTSEQLSAMKPTERSAFLTSGGQIKDAA